MTIPQHFKLRRLGAGLALLACLMVTPALASGGGDSGGGGGEIGDGNGNQGTMISINPMPITIIQNYKILGILMIDFYLDAPDNKVARTTEHFMPRLRDAYLRGLNEFASHEVRIGRPINLDRLDFYLMRETKSVMNRSDYTIYFKQVMVQTR